MPKYNLSRKYALKQYENLDLYVEGLESREEIAKELDAFDKLAEDYREKANRCCLDYPSCNHSQPIKQGDKVPKKNYPF